MVPGPGAGLEHSEAGAVRGGDHEDRRLRGGSPGVWDRSMGVAASDCANVILFHYEDLPRRDILHLGFTEGAALRQLVDAGHGRGTINVGLRHDIRQDFVEEGHNMAVDLLKLQQEGIVALGAINALQPRIRDAIGDFLLLGKGEQAIGLNTQNKGWLLDLGKSLQNGVLRIRAGTVTRNVVGIQLAGHGNVAVGIKALDKLVALVAEIRLGREVGWWTRAAIGLGWSRRRENLGAGELGIHVLNFRLRDGGVLTALRPRGRTIAVSIVVNSPVLIGRSGQLLSAIDVLTLGRVRHVASEP